MFWSSERCFVTMYAHIPNTYTERPLTTTPYQLSWALWRIMRNAEDTIEHPQVAYVCVMILLSAKHQGVKVSPVGMVSHILVGKERSRSRFGYGEFCISPYTYSRFLTPSSLSLLRNFW